MSKKVINSLPTDKQKWEFDRNKQSKWTLLLNNWEQEKEFSPKVSSSQRVIPFPTEPMLDYYKATIPNESHIPSYLSTLLNTTALAY